MSSTDWKERIPPGEPEKLEALAEVLHAIQKRRALANGGTADRALHAKANGGLVAELRIKDDVPEPLKVGIFAKSGTHRTYVRYSNGAGARQNDKAPDVRGIAMKVLGVPGKKLIPALEDATTQDFLLVRAPTAPTRTAEEFMALVAAAEKPALLPFRLMFKVGLVRAVKILSTTLGGLRAPMMPLASTTYYSIAPIMWGKHAVKLVLAPRDAAPAAPSTRGAQDGLGEELAARLASGPVTYDLRAQLFADEATTPIEDPSVEWTEAAAPAQTVAELVIAKQDPTSSAGRKLAAFVETLSFDPWHAPVEFRPLGELMRARNAAYRLSTIERKAAREPDGSESFDD
jgi:hypothetical protein